MQTRSSWRSKFSLTMLAAAFVAIFAVSLTTASATSHEHGQTVWFKDVTIGAEDVVHGDLDIVGGTVTCLDGGEIDGDVHTYGGTFDQRDGCNVEGKVASAFESDPTTSLAPMGFLSSDDFVQQNKNVLVKLSWDVVVLFAFLLFPLRVRVALDRVELHPGLSFAAGTLAIVAIVPVSLLLLLSVIGLPLIPLVFAALVAGLWIGNAAVALLIGRRLYELLRPRTTPSPLGALAVGLVVTTAAESLPGVGWAVSALVVLVGLGAALLAFIKETSFRSFTGGPTQNVSPPPAPGAPMNRPA